MMREMKDHELEMVVGGLDVGANGHGSSADRHDDIQTSTAHLMAKYLDGSAKAEPFLLAQPLSKSALNTPLNTAYTPPLPLNQQNRQLPNALKQQSRQGGPFTFKTPYLNR